MTTSGFCLRIRTLSLIQPCQISPSPFTLPPKTPKEIYIRMAFPCCGRMPQSPSLPSIQTREAGLSQVKTKQILIPHISPVRAYPVARPCLSYRPSLPILSPGFAGPRVPRPNAAVPFLPINLNPRSRFVAGAPQPANQKLRNKNLPLKSRINFVPGNRKEESFPGIPPTVRTPSPKGSASTVRRLKETSPMDRR